MTRQYIGARYVPKFADPIEWNDQTSYEAITIVNYLGASYTSKKPVPAGTLPTNTSYWALTGNYNAQVEAYRQEVAQLADEVEALGSIASMSDRIKNANILIIGGSNSVYQSGTDPTRDKWADKFKKRVEKFGCTVTNWSQGGKCLTHFNGSVGGDCVSQLIYAATADELAAYDIIIINAGVNDFREGIDIGNVDDAAAPTSGGFNAGLNSISANIHNKCPGSLIYIVTPVSNWEMYEAHDGKHWGGYPESVVNNTGFNPCNPLFVYSKAMQSWAARNGFTVIDGSAAPMLLATNSNMRATWQHDGLHVNPYSAPYAPSYADILCDYIYFHILTEISDTFHHADVRFNLKQLNADLDSVNAGNPEVHAFINDDFIDDTNTTTVTGTFSADGSFTLHCLLKGSITADADHVVMSLPKSMRPYNTIYGNAGVTVSARTWAAVIIDTDGDVHVRPSVTASTAYIVFDITFKLGCCARQIRDLQPIAYNV